MRSLSVALATDLDARVSSGGFVDSIVDLRQVIAEATKGAERRTEQYGWTIPQWSTVNLLNWGDRGPRVNRCHVLGMISPMESDSLVITPSVKPGLDDVDMTGF